MEVVVQAAGRVDAEGSDGTVEAVDQKAKGEENKNCVHDEILVRHTQCARMSRIGQLES